MITFPICNYFLWEARMDDERLCDKSVYLVMRDDELKSQLVEFLKCYASKIKTFNHANKFLSQPLSQAPSCLITSSSLVNKDGVDLIKRVNSNGLSIPIIIVATEDDNVYSAVKVLQRGAADYIQQPIMERDFIERVDRAVKQ